MSMTKEYDANENFGPIVYQDDKHVIRVKTYDGGISKAVYVHKVIGGIEQTPLGYLIGKNCLYFKAGD